MRGKVTDIVLRPKRQMTLPREICEYLGIKAGDILEVTVKDSTILARPRKTVALEALREIQKVFRQSGITEQDIQTAGRQIRKEVAGKRYGSRI